MRAGAQSLTGATCRLAGAVILAGAAFLTVTAATSPTASAVSGGRETAPRDAGSRPAVRPPTAVRLITGDLAIVRWRDGSPAVTVQSGPSRSHVGFISYRVVPDSMVVVPDDALRAVGSGVLDRRLFDVGTLARLGDTGSRNAMIRLVIKQRPGSRPVRLSRHGIVRVWFTGRGTRALTVRVADIGALWQALWSRTSPTGLATGVTWVGLALPENAGLAARSYATRTHVPTYNLTISAIDRNGNPYSLQFAELDSFRPQDQASGHLQRFVTSGTLRLPAGKYVLNGLVETGTFGQPGYSQTFAMLVINLRRNQNAVLDARKGVGLDVSLNDPSAAPYVTYLGSAYLDGGYPLTSGLAWPGPGTVYATPITAKGIGFYWHTTWLKAGWSYQAPSPIRYDLGQSYPNGVPTQLTFAFQQAHLAALNVTYRAQGAPEFGSLVHWMGLSDGDQEHFQYGSYVTIPAHVKLYFSPNVPWIRWMWLTTPPLPPNGNETPTYMLNRQTADVFRARSYSDTWDSLVIGPDVPVGGGLGTGCGSDWIDNIFGIGRPGFDASDQTMTRASLSLYRGKKRISHFNLMRIPFYDICIVPKPGDVIDVLAARDDSATPVSPTVDETFKMVRLPRPDQALSWQFVRFSPHGLNDYGQAVAGGRTAIAIAIELQPGAPATPVRSVKVQVSADGGRTWHTVTASGRGGHWSVTVPDPARPGYVSLRATVTDRNGNMVTDTIFRAYRIVA